MKDPYEKKVGFSEFHIYIYTYLQSPTFVMLLLTPTITEEIRQKLERLVIWLTVSLIRLLLLMD